MNSAEQVGRDKELMRTWLVPSYASKAKALTAQRSFAARLELESHSSRRISIIHSDPPPPFLLATKAVGKTVR